MRCWATRRREGRSKEIRMVNVKLVSAVRAKVRTPYILQSTQNKSQFHHLDMTAEREIKNSAPNRNSMHRKTWFITTTFRTDEKTSGHCSLDTYLNCLKLQSKLMKTARSSPLFFSLQDKWPPKPATSLSDCADFGISVSHFQYLALSDLTIWASVGITHLVPDPSKRSTTILPMKWKYYREEDCDLPGISLVDAQIQMIQFFYYYENE